jgi:c(7)-type cytochrome triheme protein
MRWGQLLGWIGILGMGICIWTVNLNAQPEEIKLDDHTVFTARQRPAVAFPHMLHIDAGTECKSCHHRFKDGENILDEAQLEEGAAGIKCAACHKNRTGFWFNPDMDPTKRTLQQAYHRLCIGCHRQLRQDNKKAGPLTCGECHPRNSPQS